MHNENGNAKTFTYANHISSQCIKILYHISKKILYIK